MDAHKVAKLIVAKIEDTDKMPELFGYGLCNLLARHGSDDAWNRLDLSASRYFDSFLPGPVIYLPD